MFFPLIVVPVIFTPVRFGTLLWVSRMKVKCVALWMPRAFVVRRRDLVQSPQQPQSQNVLANSSFAIFVIIDKNFSRLNSFLKLLQTGTGPVAGVPVGGLIG